MDAHHGYRIQKLEFYYAGVTVIDEVSVLNLEHIILFKIKAWLDLFNRRKV